MHVVPACPACPLYLSCRPSVLTCMLVVSLCRCEVSTVGIWRQTTSLLIHAANQHNTHIDHHDEQRTDTSIRAILANQICHPHTTRWTNDTHNHHGQTKIKHKSFVAELFHSSPPSLPSLTCMCVVVSPLSLLLLC